MEADERDNARERQREQDVDSNNRRRDDRLNEARVIKSAHSRGRRDEEVSPREDEEMQSEQDYVSSSMASSFDYRALTDEEKQKILNGDGPPGSFSLGGAKP